MKKYTGIIIGALLVAIGVIYILNAFGIGNINVSLDGWWTLFIIIPCLERLFREKDKSGNLLGLFIGIILLLAARDIISDGLILKLIVPFIIIAIGIKLIEKSTRGRKKEAEIFTKEEDPNAETCVAKVGAVFSGTKCNLTDAKMQDGSRIDLFCMFGGADIIVPENVRVKINTFCLFGGVSDKRQITHVTDTSATLTINGFCMFGGADIK